MNKRSDMSKKAVVTWGSLILTFLLISSVFSFPVSMVNAKDRVPNPIEGTAVYCNGGNADGALVTIVGPSTETTNVGPAGGWGTGYWQIDVGDPGPNWPVGSSYTVEITDGAWSSGTVGPFTLNDFVTGNNVGEIVLDPPALVASASGSPTTILVGETVSFTGSATGGATPYSWSWDFGGDGTSTQQNPSHTFNTQGTYDCVLTVTDDCGNSDTDSELITVNAALSCDAGGPYTGSQCSPVSFSGSASGGIPPYSYSWDFGDGGSGTGANPSHQYTSDGPFTATLTVTDTQGSATDTAQVTISTSAVSADAGGPYSGTLCSPVSFSGSASGGCSPYSYSWDFGDGGSGSGASPSHLYGADGTYTVTLTVTDDIGQTDSDTATVTIDTTPVSADAGGPYEGNEDDEIEFFGSASGGCNPYSYSWDFGDGGSSSGQNPTHIYADPGTYTVTLTVTDDVGLTGTDTTTCTVLEATVIADAGGPYSGETGVPVEFSGSASEGIPPYTFEWDFGDGGSASGQNPTYTYQLPGTYDVILTVYDSMGNTDSDLAQAVITGDPPEDPIADAGGPYSGTVNEPVDFTGSVAGGDPPFSYEWDFGDGSTSSDQNPSYSYTATGVFDVSLTVTDDNGKTDTDTTTVTISEGSPDLVCMGSLSWSSVESGAEVSSSFTVSNGGAAGTSLTWEITSVPDWGTWSFSPDGGAGLTPEDGLVTVDVSVVAPSVKARLFVPVADETFDGVVVVENVGDPSDSCEIPVSMVVPRARFDHPLAMFLSWLVEQFPVFELFFEL